MGKEERDRQNRKERTGQAEQESQNGTGRTGKSERDRQNRKDKIGYAEQDFLFYRFENNMFCEGFLQ
jgi:hypothetical protein